VSSWRQALSAPWMRARHDRFTSPRVSWGRCEPERAEGALPGLAASARAPESGRDPRLDARSLASIVEGGDGSTDRASGGAHDLLPVRFRDDPPIRILSKNADGILPHFHPSAVPDSPRRPVPRRPGRHAWTMKVELRGRAYCLAFPFV
jgi:hypothetical protein